ncbi:hypothetical protein MMC29_004074, partial [Sticta canariensis]|nr:hypothetical protein [Sticta canariensis]
MAVNPAQAPTSDAFVLPDDEAYATTRIETFNVAEFLLTKLEPIDLEELDSADRVCAICQNEFRVSEVVKQSHTPVKTPCGHIFGEKCIIKWLQPVSFWGMKEDYNTGPEEDHLGVTHGKTNCPMCRLEFFPNFQVEPMELLAQRLFFWDMAYGNAGVALSDRERHSRRILWKFVEYCHSMDELEHNAELARLHAKLAFVRWLIKLRDRNLTPRQKQLRQNLK